MTRKVRPRKHNKICAYDPFAPASRRASSQAYAQAHKKVGGGKGNVPKKPKKPRRGAQGVEDAGGAIVGGGADPAEGGDRLSRRLKDIVTWQKKNDPDAVVAVDTTPRPLWSSRGTTADETTPETPVKIDPITGLPKRSNKRRKPKKSGETPNEIPKLGTTTAPSKASSVAVRRRDQPPPKPKPSHNTPTPGRKHSEQPPQQAQKRPRQEQVAPLQKPSKGLKQQQASDRDSESDSDGGDDSSSDETPSNDPLDRLHRHEVIKFGEVADCPPKLPPVTKKKELLPAFMPPAVRLLEGAPPPLLPKSSKKSPITKTNSQAALQQRYFESLRDKVIKSYAEAKAKRRKIAAEQQLPIASCM
ncbi:hypothetical protein Pelo_6121 [Pelomyxa schiedti]|nr:hypothetical protein Pelo_6121 [Pelomyxa schiedti]